MIRRLTVFGLWSLVSGLFLGCGKSDPSTAASSTRPPFVAKADSAGTSMLPTFAVRETVALELCAYSALRGNDTVIRWDPIIKQFVHHRLESRDATGLWTTRGDNNPGADRGHMTADTFIGRTHKLAP